MMDDILRQIDEEIARLEQVRDMLGAGGMVRAKRTGRPPKTVKKRNLSPEGRRRIAEAVKRRWAEQKKKAGK